MFSNNNFQFLNAPSNILEENNARYHNSVSLVLWGFKSNIQDCVSRGPRSCNPISGGKLVIVSVVGHKPNLLIYYEALLLHNPIYYFMLV